MAAKPRNRPPAGRTPEVYHVPVYYPSTDWNMLAAAFALGMLFAVWYIRAGGE